LPRGEEEGEKMRTEAPDIHQGKKEKAAYCPSDSFEGRRDGVRRTRRFGGGKKGKGNNFSPYNLLRGGEK